MSTGLLQQLNSELSIAVKDVQRSLVQISNGWGGVGAGAIWHAAGLVIIKNFFQGCKVYNR
jgi:hypothetical protein